MEEVGRKKGISPVVATVLLVAIVIIIALIVFLWFRNIGGETCTKFQGQNIELICGNAEFFADYDPNTGELYISNTGNVPIFGMEVRFEDESGIRTKEATELGGNWPSLGLNQGGAYTSGNIIPEIGGSESIILTPILMGSCGGVEKAYTCNVEQHGYEIPIF